MNNEEEKTNENKEVSEEKEQENVDISEEDQTPDLTEDITEEKEQPTLKDFRDTYRKIESPEPSPEKYNYVSFEESRKKRNLILIIIAGILVVLIAASAIIWFLFRVDAKLLVTGKKNYYAKIETAGIKKLGADVETKNNNINTDKKYRLSSKITGSYENVPNFDAQIMQLNELLKSSSVDYIIEEDTAAKKSKTEVKATINKLINLSVESITDENRFAFRVPQANEKYILSETKTARYDGLDSMLKEYTGKGQNELAQMFEGYYNDVVQNSITDKDITFNTNDRTQDISCNSITIALSTEAYSAMLSTLADKIENDNDLLSIVQTISDKINYGTIMEVGGQQTQSPASEDIKTKISKFANDLREDSKNLNEGTFTYKIWFDNDEKIIARQIEDSESITYLFLNQTEDNNKFIFNAESKTEDKAVFNITFDGEGGTDVADFTLSANYSDNTLKDQFKLLWTNKLEEKMNGSITVDITDGQKPTAAIYFKYAIELDLTSIAFPLIGTYNLEVKDGDNKTTFKMEAKTEEITKNFEFKTTIEISDTPYLINPDYKDMKIILYAITKYEELQNVSIPDIDSLQTVKLEDVDINEYLQGLLNLTGGAISM